MPAAVVGALRVTLGLDSAEFTSGINRASKSTKQFQQSSESLSKSANSTSIAVKGLSAAFGALSIGAAAKSFLDLANQSKQMTTQLKLATAAFGNFGKAQTDVRRIASETRSGLTETTKLYGTFVRAVKDAGGSQNDAARATETFSKALKIGGASTEEAASATLQFGQALASGALQGDELRSILEASPRLARLLSESLGVTVGQLKQLGSEGKLTSDKLIDALTKQKFTESIDQEFKQLPVTFGDAMTQIQNSATTVFGAFDEGGQFTNTLAAFAAGGAANFESLANSAGRFGSAIRTTAEGVIASLGPVLSFLGGIRSVLNDISKYGGPQNKLDLPNAGQYAAAFDSGTFNPLAPLRRVSAFGEGIRSAFNGGTFRAGFDQAFNSTSATAALDRYNKGVSDAALRTRLDKIMGGDPLADYVKTSPPAPKINLEKPAKAKKVKPEKDKVGVPLYGKAREDFLNSSIADYLPSMEGVFDFRVALNDALDEPLDFTAINKSAERNLDWLADKFKKTAEDGSQSMANLVNNSLNALNNFANSLKSGGFLDILSSAFNAFGSIAKTGLFGSKLATGFKDFTSITSFGGARAFGGPVTDGKTYLVGERGPELFTATRSGYIHPNGANDNSGGLRVQVVKGDLFDVIVDRRADARVGAASPAIVSGASTGAQTAIGRKQSRRLA